MSSSGWIKIHKKILEWEWYDDLNTCRVFFHLLLKANWIETRWQDQVVEAGELVTSRKILAEETNLSEMQVRVALEKLKVTSEITSRLTSGSFPKLSIIKLNKWDEYQMDNQENNQKNNQKTDPPSFPLSSSPSSSPPYPPNNNPNNLPLNHPPYSPKESEGGKHTPSEIANKFFSEESYRKKVAEVVASKYGTPSEKIYDEIKRFVSYWTEPNKSGTKVRWQLEPTFEVSRRLETWLRRSGQDSRKGTIQSL